MTDEFLASEASRLLSDRTFLRAVADMRLEALEALASCENHELFALQSRVWAVDNLIDQLKRYMDAVDD
jgi:hypothetical protein